MDPGQFLLRQHSAFENRHPASVDSFYKVISWKQYFAIICIKLCGGNPTINQLSEVMGSSHQNVNQILLKLEKKGFVHIEDDVCDRRKQRISIT
ncbi:MAG: MarR family transcriptional regulator [Clostridiales bacterium]|jgi:DNA-binding MarR family transcriptional regulator|nr:MarR family transcriptional regulator [Clostridiales bacterium]